MTAGSVAVAVEEAWTAAPMVAEHCGSWPWARWGHAGCSPAGSSDAVEASIGPVAFALATVEKTFGPVAAAVSAEFSRS